MDCPHGAGRKLSRAAGLLCSALGLRAVTRSTVGPVENLCSAGNRAVICLEAAFDTQDSFQDSQAASSFLHPALTGTAVSHGCGPGGAGVSLCLLVLGLVPLPVWTREH